jgi:hypothetical protein
MTKTRTTVILPTELLKLAKHRAIEDKLNLSSLIEESLKNFLQIKEQSVSDEEGIKEARKEQLKGIAGSIQAGITMNPKQFKEFIDHTYEEEMLS